MGMKVNALIERTENGYYSIACDGKIGIFCLGGFGDSVKDAKADFDSIVKEAQDNYIKEYGNLPDELKQVTVEYR